MPLTLRDDPYVCSGSYSDTIEKKTLANPGVWASSKNQAMAFTWLNKNKNKTLRMSLNVKRIKN